jgi:histidyl-tRNA synthetase
MLRPSGLLEVFEALGWHGTYTIKCNYRKILDGIFEVCGVPAEKIRTISIAVDKLDKMPWSMMRREMVEENGLKANVADRIEWSVTRKGGRRILDELSKDGELMANANARAGMEEMSLLMDYMTAFGILDDRISFDMSLARGLDYYTGAIYEVVTEGSAPVVANCGGGETAQNVQRSTSKEKMADADEDRSDDPSLGVGSVAAGGRYDNLVERFLPKAQMPCVGVSFGVDRIFSITKARMEREKLLEAMRASETDVYVMAFGGKGFDGMLPQRMSVCKTLWDAGVKAAESASVPLAVILGEDEQKAGKVKIKEMGLPEGHPEKDGVLVDIKDLTAGIKQRLAMKAETAGQLADLVGSTVVLTVGRGEVEQTS